MTRYFELEDDVDIHGRWYLGGLCDCTETEFDPRQFRYGLTVDCRPPLRLALANEDKRVAVKPPLTVSLSRIGTPLDWTYAAFDMPVVTARVAEIINTVARSDVQVFPVHIEAEVQEYRIINVVSRLDCIDPEQSQIMWWTEADDRPDKLGKPRMITKLVIDPKRARRAEIFRPEGWEVVVIVSEVVKMAMEAEKVTGIRFTPVW